MCVPAASPQVWLSAKRDDPRRSWGSQATDELPMQVRAAYSCVRTPMIPCLCAAHSCSIAYSYLRRLLTVALKGFGRRSG